MFFILCFPHSVSIYCLSLFLFCSPILSFPGPLFTPVLSFNFLSFYYFLVFSISAEISILCPKGVCIGVKNTSALLLSPHRPHIKTL